jgi:hypothetical protein
MGLIDVLFSFCTFWAGLHALKYLLSRLHSANSSRELTRSRAVLPLDRNPPSSVLSFAHYLGHKTSHFLGGLRLDVSLSTVNLRVETTALNEVFDKASTQFAHSATRSDAIRTEGFLERFYSFGAALGLVGMGTGYSLLLWSCLAVFRGSDKTTNMQNTTYYTQNDELLSSSEGTNMGGTGLAVQPIVSGYCLFFVTIT